jgi:CRP/FNR family transcriptional regulator, dissimilatory nitrate respiration regulator
LSRDDAVQEADEILNRASRQEWPHRRMRDEVAIQKARQFDLSGGENMPSVIPKPLTSRSSPMRTGKIRFQDFLSKMPLFSEVSADELDVLALGTTEVRVPCGATVFRRGDPCSGFHTVVYGLIKLSFSSPVGEEKIVRLVGPGDGFGEALMFMDKAYIVSAQALDDTLLLHVKKSVVVARLEQDPVFARKMLASLSTRLHNLMRDVEAYSLQSGTQRVVGYLLNLVDDSSPIPQQVRLETGKRLIASRLNITPQHFSRILRDLSVRQLIQINGRDITIPDITRLRNS